ncbi:AfsR/SARP family transcriptional regulator [Phytohabitans houttuyneae]|uniref:AfsR/SARP family transcriptional regulator n=1 Tax=Phytohabitans houttuyneae TaxID=1076126 RepID=UPI0015B6969B|nr:BTAD domain-containing putative transcriptional regulator [Phytohabitans houttuyneae]
MVDALWGSRPPPTAVNMLHSRVKHLRRLLEPQRRRFAGSEILPAVGDGYALGLPADRVDLSSFRDLADAAAVAHGERNPRQAADLLGRALRLWQGPPLADLPLLAGHPKVVALIEQHRTVVARYGESLIEAGDPAAAVPVLEQAVAAHPLDETTCALLVRACHAAGRRGQAFAVYHETRRRLAEQLGVDPAPQLAAAHEALLQDDGRSNAALKTAVPTAPRPSPAQLPADLAAFTGRTDSLRQLDDLLPGDTAVASVGAVSGAAGVGKTTLVVHWAHRVQDRFPDGQLYVNLHGFAPGAAATSPEEALRGFLDALRVPATQIPRDLPAQAALYRSLLAGKRMLVVLDNARDAEQVRPLLPGAPGCLVVVTSRNRLASLVAVEGARPLPLDLLTVGEARQFLTRRLGRRRIDGEPEAVDAIISACARLPLALAVVAARAATHPHFSLTALAGQLRGPAGGLDALAGEDAVTDVRTVFSWSYDALSQDARRLLRLLGAHPGPEIATAAAASLAGAPVESVRPLLTELTRLSLVNEPVPGRYSFHDLLRAYAVELAHAHDAQPERHDAQRRMFDHYLHTSHDATALLYPHPARVTPAPAHPGVTIEPLNDRPQALAWVTTELPVLLNTVTAAADAGFTTYCWQLVVTLAEYLEGWARWHDWADAVSTALRAAREHADLVGQANAHWCLANARFFLGSQHDADTHVERALELFTQLDDQAGLARTHHSASALTCDPQTALRHARQALTLYRAAGNRSGQAHALNNACQAQLFIGAHDEALRHGEQALTIFQETGNTNSEAYTWDTLGTLHQVRGDHQQAITCFHNALALLRDIGERVVEAGVLCRLGALHVGLDNLAAARDAWHRALSIYDKLGPPDAASGLRARLDGLDQSPASR